MKSVPRRKKAETTLINLKVTSEELKAIRGRAKRFANGNVSRWMRFAGLNHTPRSKDLK